MIKLEEVIESLINRNGEGKPFYEFPLFRSHIREQRKEKIFKHINNNNLFKKTFIVKKFIFICSENSSLQSTQCFIFKFTTLEHTPL